jgi:DMSO/TMAO reductase YedYZ molybdopterin-dependent catalytic subunit
VIGHRRRSALALAAALALAVLVAVACGDEPAQLGSSPSTVASGPVILTVTGPDGTRDLTMPELQSLPAFEGYAGIKSSTGMITPPAVHKGVPLEEVVGLVGGLGKDEGVTITAGDGYGMTLSHEQTTGEGLVTYDPATGAETPPDMPLTVMLAYEREGKLLGEDEGPLRLVAAQPKMGQVIDGHWTVKWVTAVEVKKETAPWRVALQGAVSARLDRGKYVNCASPGCHGSGYIDDEDRRWEGIPLYLVCGLVDDDRRHGEGAYDAHAARAGYTIEIETADGEVVRLDSRDIAGKRSIVLAGKLDGADLPEEYFPLRLVGPGLDEEVQVGRIARIVVRVR